jgi:hypothetical protein
MTDTADDFINVANQYRVIRAARCECGGRLKPKKVALKEEGDGLYDLHETLCVKCGKARQFKFRTVFTKKEAAREKSQE